MKDLMSRHGIPETIVSDNGTQFKSKEFAQMCEENGIEHLFSAPYHPQSNGQAERFVDTFKRTIGKLKGEGKFQSALPQFLMNYRSTPSAVLGGKTPAELFTGRTMRTRLSLMKPKERKFNMVMKESPMKVQFDRKHGAVEREFQVESRVYFRANSSFHWLAGRITDKSSNRNYDVTLVTGRIVKAHPNQLRNRNGKPIPKLDQEEYGYDLLAWTFGLPPGTGLRPSLARPSRVSTPAVKRTPSTTRKKPQSPAATVNPQTPRLRRTSTPAENDAISEEDSFEDAEEGSIDADDVASPERTPPRNAADDARSSTSEEGPPTEAVADSPPRRGPTGRRIRAPVRFSPEVWPARRPR